ncbi:hypothetical protein O181_072087 [Austropuccinia psidii MF-1]|uniref:Uncharacterized protein n=1 Tax=Austropuccinia psidii MF-1 TaxID=1389203 RepID=A0A9Q3F6F4_9BASI|nr:hypothetical protein [Austropuccinia psidii MF-1]
MKLPLRLTTVERLVEETCPSSQTPIVNKKKKSKKLVLLGPTIQYSEEDPNTQSNQMELESEVELIPQRGTEREKSPVEQNPHKEVPYPKEVSNRHLYKPVQTLLHSVQGKVLGNASTNPPRSNELLAHPEKILERGGNNEILQWIRSTIIQASNQKIKEYHSKKREARNEEAPVASTSFSKKGRRTRKRTGGSHIPQATGSKKIQKDAVENVFNMVITLMEFKQKEEK